jgi:hypothetical protein
LSQKSIETIKLTPAEKKKLPKLTILLRNYWIEMMKAKGIAEKTALYAVLQYFGAN